MKKIINRSVMVALLTGFSGAALAQYQEVSVNYEQSGESKQAAMIEYNVSGGELTTGIGFRLHFDSHLLEITEIVSYHDDSNLGIQIMEDVDDLDGNPATDYYINAAWVDLSGYWPDVAKLPTTLYRVEYDTLMPDSKDLFSVSVSETAVGFEFVSQVN